MKGSHRSLARFSSAIALVALLAACDSSTEPQQPIIWEGDIAAVGTSEVTGAVLVSASSTAFAAEIEIENGTPDAVLHWQVAAGSCADPGARVGAAGNYPDLEVEEDGTATAEANVSASLSISAAYHVSVYVEDDEEDVVLACGNLS